MKSCSECGVTKPIEEFRKNCKASDGRQSACKECAKARDKRDYADSTKRKSQVAKNNERRRSEARMWIREYLLTHPCVDCGESDPIVLEFDHRDSKEKVAGISQMTCGPWSMSAIIKEVSKCEIRCANCHRKRTATQFGWYATLA